MTQEQDFNKQRDFMIETQLRGRGIRDERVIAAMRQIPRHLFVRSKLQGAAYGDNPLPIGHKQTISQPYIVAHMTEMLHLPPDKQATVLEVGTGSGYQAAVLSQLANKVYTVERVKALAVQAHKVFQQLNLDNIEVKVSDGGYGWPDHAPYDAIITTAAAPDIPPPLVAQLADGGTLVGPIGSRRQQRIVRLKRQGDTILKEDLTRVAFVPMLGEHGWAD